MAAARSQGKQGKQGGSHDATAQVALASEAPIKFKRAYHTKTRTGCKTCKTRRVRCDEAKPACKRCTVSGRKCDGYDTTALFPFPQTASSIAHQGKLQLIAAKPLDLPATGASVDSDMLLHRIGRPPEEMRSYRFFVDVTAPSLAGAFDSHFWTKEIPRVCHMNATIWHAVVSLGSAHEEYVSGRPARLKPNGFALRHFNAAIGELTKPTSRPQPWVALTASTLFTYVCILDGQLEQAVLHFQAGCKLLGEAQRDMAQRGMSVGSDSDSSDSDDQQSYNNSSSIYSSPVSLSAIHDILLNIEVMAAKLSIKTTAQPPKLLTPKCRFFDWQTFQVPPAPPAFGRCLTGGNLSKAVAAAESFFMTVLISTMHRAIKLQELYGQGGFELLQAQPLFRDPEQVVEGFKEIDKAIHVFRRELDRGPKIRPTELKDLRKAFFSLCFVHDTNRMMLSQDPDEPNDQKRLDSQPALCKRSIDLAEEMFRLESKIGCLRSGGTVTTATVMNPLLYVAKCGFHRATRERAIKLLYVPRVEGAFDTQMSAILGHKMMARETVATREYRMQPHLNGITIDHPTARGWDGNGDDREFIHPLARICNYNMRFTGPKEAIIGLRTWKEWLEGSPGIETTMSW